MPPASCGYGIWSQTKAYLRHPDDQCSSWMGCSGDPSEEVIKLIHLKVKTQYCKKIPLAFNMDRYRTGTMTRGQSQ